MDEHHTDNFIDDPNPTATESPVDPAVLLRLLEEAEKNLAEIRRLISGGSAISAVSRRPRPAAQLAAAAVDPEGARVIEGVFDGQNMVGPDGKQYSVPANYASKSKLVEGDVLKLTITRDGSFIYKQIGPIDRQRLIGRLVRDQTSGEYRVEAGNKSYKVLLASVTYFKGEADDEVVVLVPTEGEARWAAVENIIKTAATAETESV